VLLQPLINVMAIESHISANLDNRQAAFICQLANEIVASGNTASVKWIVDIKMLSTLVEAVRENINNLSSNIQSPGETSPNIIDQIKQLSQLHEVGILTDEEFNLKKKSLLDKI
jgi:hypothetical protein